MAIRNDQSMNRAIKQTRLTISAANYTIDELMQTLLENPLPAIDGYMHIMWDYDEPDFFDLFLTEDEELPNEAATELKETLTGTISEMIGRQSFKIEDESEEESVESEKINIYEMTPEEILERIKCRCNELKNKSLKKKLFEDQQKFATVPEPDSTSHSTRSYRKPKKNIKIVQSSSETEAPGEEAEEEKSKCWQFSKMKDYATFFIDDLLEEAAEKANAALPAQYTDESNMYSEGAEEYSGEMSSAEYSSICSSIPIKAFTPAAGRELILESIQTWNLKKPWNYCINFIAEDSDTCADFYKYEVIWSLPTSNYPIPQATASVYYTIEVSRVKEDHCPVVVTYNFETERYTFNLQDEIHHEVFLNNIIKCKKNFFKALRI